MAAGGPASTIGFSLARDYNGRTVVGTATGVVNVGGFSAAILASLLVGGILDLAGRSDVPAWPSAAPWPSSFSARSWRSAGGCASAACCSGPSHAASRSRCE